MEANTAETTRVTVAVPARALAAFRAMASEARVPLTHYLGTWLDMTAVAAREVEDAKRGVGASMVAEFQQEARRRAGLPELTSEKPPKLLPRSRARATERSAS
jgi:hypothetical protein